MKVYVVLAYLTADDGTTASDNDFVEVCATREAADKYIAEASPFIDWYVEERELRA